MIKAEISARFSIGITALRAFIVTSLANSAARLKRCRGALRPAPDIERGGNADAERRRRGSRTLHWCRNRLPRTGGGANSRSGLTRVKQAFGAENPAWNSAPRWDLID